MISRTRDLLFAVALMGTAFTSPARAADKLYDGPALNALVITGGCCHNYFFQSQALTQGISKQANVNWTIVHQGGGGTRGQISLYADPDWAAPYDVIVHNECYADTKDPRYVRRITDAHRAGKPAVVIHCAMHTYRSAEIDDWRTFLGVTSRHHEHQSNYPVKILQPEHPVMRGIPTDWVTPMDELYIVKKLWPNATALAESKSEKTGEMQPVIWVNQFDKARVFGTTYGHSDATFRDQTFIDILARGLLWSAGKLE
jgi:type 1 glutamine amidotransferase